MHRSSLPPDLGDVFSTRAAREAGVSASRLRAKDLTRPFHGVRARSGDEPEMLLTRARQYVSRMGTHEFFSHLLAAELWGIPLPATLLAARLLDVAVPWPRRAPAGRGVRGHSLRPELVQVVAHPATGWQVSSPASTWAMLAPRYTCIADAVAAADALVRRPLHESDPPALTTVEQLQAATDAGRRTGGALLTAALPWVRTSAQSRPESLLRMLLVEAGLPEPLGNLDVFAAGVWLARVDLGYPDAKLALEYEGRHHLVDPVQWASDIRRADRLVEAGWRVVRVTADDLFVRPDALVARIRRALAR